MGFTLSSKIQDLFLLNLKFKQESRIYSNHISISSKIWEFKKSKSQLQARSENLKYKISITSWAKYTFKTQVYINIQVNIGLHIILDNFYF